MRTQLTKIVFSATFGLALAFTFSACSSDSGDPPPTSGGVPSSNSSGGTNQMVFCKITAGTCSQMSLSTCLELVNSGMAQIVPNCTAESSSSFSTPSSSSSNTALPSLSSSSTDWPIACGIFSYSPSTQFCSDRTIYDKCGGNEYDPSTQFCSIGTVKNYGSLTDGYDGKKYKTVVIGTQTWMAENLNFAQTDSKCYDNLDANCTKYGRLYTWSMAKVVCPTGWHLPSDAEWDVLVNYAGGATAGTKLKAKNGWNTASGYKAGTDNYGFAALPGGNGSSCCFSAVGNGGYWWSASEISANDASSPIMGYDIENVYRDSDIKLAMLSVRCVKN